jgi:hypothetical protein
MAFPNTSGIGATSVETPVTPAIKPHAAIGSTDTIQSVKRSDNVTAGSSATLGDITGAVNDATYWMHTSTYTGGLPGTYVAAEVQFLGFGAGGTIKTGRPYIRFVRPTSGATSPGTISLYYTLDGTVGTPVWVFLNDYVGSPLDTGVEVVGPELANVDLSKFGLGVRFAASQVSGTGTKTSVHRLTRCAFEVKQVASYVGVATGGIGVIHGDGATNYGNLRRPFPGRQPTPNQTVFTASTLSHVRFMVRKHVTSSPLDAGLGVEVRLFDYQNAAQAWAVDTVDVSEIGNEWVLLARKFVPGTDVKGADLQIEWRTLNTQDIEIAFAGFYRGDTPCAWAPSPEEQTTGFFGDFVSGEPTGLTKGAWVAGDRKRSALA